MTKLHWHRWPRIDEALTSYEQFRTLRINGTIPEHVRFQGGLPFPTSALNAFKDDVGADYPVAARGYANLAARELDRLTATIPPDDLAIQWDICYEVLDIEGVPSWTTLGAWERFTAAVERLTKLLPEDTLVGYHLCYGTFPEWPMFEARDMGLIMRMTNYAATHSGRPVDWFHPAGPRYLRSQEPSFFRPLIDLDVGDARVILGIVLPIDGLTRLRQRHATASGYLSDFGVAMYCGFGRQPGEDGERTMSEHGQVVRTLHS